MFLPELLGECAAMVGLRDTVARLLDRSGRTGRLPSVLITGETGTGKGALARAIHRAGPRAGRPFVDINCAAIPETLLESELFGHERGAFTDARHAKPGLFHAAHGGTIFLDEIGLLPEGLQAKVLKALEERVVRKLGSTRSEPVDVWVLAATSEDLLAATRAHRFRKDLYHRLAVLVLSLPPLRERGRDILLLVRHFLAHLCADYGLAVKTLAPDAEAALLAHAWPGNVRELANVIERVALLSEGAMVTADTLGLRDASAGPAVTAGAGPERAPLEEAKRAFERAQLCTALEATGWNVVRAATRLGISRDTLRYRMVKHDVTRRSASRRSRGSRDAPRVPAAAPPPLVETRTSAALRWERRRLALLAAQLSLPDDGEAPLAWSRIFEMVVEKIGSFGGRVEELSSRLMVASFGVEPSEDAPLRATRAAMAIRRAIQHARDADGNPVVVKLGIHSAQVLVAFAGGSTEIDLEAKRDAWGALERLLAVTDPGAMAATVAAGPFLGRWFELRPLGPDGSAFRVVSGERPAPSGPAFVGRVDELEVLQSRLATAMSGRAQVVSIVGEAGIGKSRLVYEFRARLTAGVAYREGRCVSYGSTVPYLPIVDMLRQNFGLTEADDPPAIAQKVRADLEIMDLPADTWSPYVLHLLGVGERDGPLGRLSPDAVKAHTLEMLRQLCLGGSRRRPIVCVIEDLHWADRTSEECVASLVDTLVGTPILLIVTYRPGYQPPWMGKSYVTQLPLAPLSDREGRRVLDSLLSPESVSADLARRLLDKAEGNPFFLEELCRIVREQGVRAAETAVPDTIEDVLRARLDRLPPEPRRLLQTIAVQGRAVSRRLVSATWDGPPETLDPLLRELMRLEFLYEQTRRGELVLVFAHALTHEVAYGALLTDERRELHARAGRALEDLYAGRLEEVYDRLAHHFARTREAGKALDYLLAAAAKATRAHAHAEALTMLREGLAHVPGLPAAEQDARWVELALRQASSLIPLGRFQEIPALLLPYQDVVGRLPHRAHAAAYQVLLGLTWSFLGDHAGALRSGRQGLEEAVRSGQEVEIGKAHYVLALEGALSGRAWEGVEHGREAVAWLERSADRSWLGPGHWVFGLNLAQLGDFEAALAAHARAAAIGEASGDRRLQTLAAWGAGIVHVARGDAELGVDTCDRALQQAPDLLNTAVAAGWLGYAYLEAGEARRAIAVLEQATREVAQFGFTRFDGWFHAFLAEALCLDGDATGAQDVARRALETLHAARFPYGIGWVERALGRIAYRQARLAEAGAHLERALDAFTRSRARYDIARTRLDLALLSMASADMPAAADRLQAARELFAALALPRFVERTEKLANEAGLTLPGRRVVESSGARNATPGKAE